MKISSVTGLILVLMVVTGCTSGTKSYTPSNLSGVIWGTTYSITYYAGDNGADSVGPAVSSALDQVGSIANAYDPTSEISRLNSNGSLENPSAGFCYLLERSRYISGLTDGAFDPTVGPLVDLWGFGAGSTGKSVTETEIENARALVGLSGVISDSGKIVLQKNGSRLDFAAIAKGYGVDRVASALTRLGLKDYMVEIGGEIQVAGHSPRGEEWRIQIDAPVTDSTAGHTRLAVVRLTDTGMATSGNYRNYHRDTESGALVGHTISPLSGRPITTDILSATIFAADATTADALATASMVMGLDEARTLITRLASDAGSGVYGAIFVTSGNSGNTFDITSINIPNEHVKIEQ